MELCSAYKAINQSVLNVAKSTNILTIPENHKPADYVRMVEAQVKISDATKRVCQVVTAHNLEEYKNVFHSIKMKRSSDIWLDHLLKIDEREET